MKWISGINHPSTGQDRQRREHGKADYHGKGGITINMLDLHLSERVKELTGGQQTPTTAKPSTIPDFPVAVKR